jgi:hypothetical protein
MLSLLFQYIWGQAKPGDATGLLPDKIKRVFKTPKGVRKLGVNKQDFHCCLLLLFAFYRAGSFQSFPAS